MSLNLIVNGVSYPYPVTGDQTWGDNATNWASAVTSGMLQKAGGLFTLTAEVDFGATYGLKLVYIKSRTANVASAGQVRLAKTDSINFRNNANSADLTLGIDSSNNLSFNGSTVIISGLIVNADVAAGAGIVYSKLNLSTSILNSDINASAAIAYSKLALSNSIVNSDINAAAAISRTKLASGIADHVVINDASGVISSEATLATSRGGTNISGFAAGDILYASSSTVLTRLPVGTSNQVLTVIAGIPSWQPAPSGTLPPGIIAPFGGNTVPTGWLECDNSVVSQATYAALFANIGTLWNTGGEGAGNFRLPPSARKTFIGRGGSGTAIVGNAVGNTGGEETHVLTAVETGIRSHTHIVPQFGAGAALQLGAFAGGATSNHFDVSTDSASSDVTSSDASGVGASGAAHNIMQPVAVAMYIIKT